MKDETKLWADDRCALITFYIIFMIFTIMLWRTGLDTMIDEFVAPMLMSLFITVIALILISIDYVDFIGLYRRMKNDE